MPSTPQLEHARAIIATADAKLDALRRIKPYLLDVSLRETLVGSAVGQTLQDKLDMLPQLRAFGFANVSLGTLDYALPDEPEVEDDFMRHLRDHGADRRGCFAFTALGIEAADGTFTPDPSQRYGYRVCPAISDSAVIAGRLAEVTGQPASAFPAALTERMIVLMRRDLRAGLRIVYDQPAHLLELLSRARCDEPQEAAAGAPELAISPS